MRRFGTTADGRDVQAIDLHAHGLSVTLLTFGALVQAVQMDGVPHDLTVGSDELADYEGPMHYHGVIVGPVANRISGGSTVIEGVSHQFDRNFLGKHTLHGGTRGTQTRIWTTQEASETSATLTLDLPDGDGGFPGSRHMTAHYEITTGPSLTLSITTHTDATTLVNATNHSYWCLDGSGSMDGHTLQIHADHYLPTTSESLPTGDVEPVEGTPFDFRQPRALSLGAHPYDNTLCLAPVRGAMKEALVLEGGGVRMTVSTTEPGLHIYDDRPAHCALAIEAQSWPDAPANPAFPSIEVTPDLPLVQTTQWRFAKV